MNMLFVIVGGLAALIGLLLLVTALRGRVGESRKSTAQLIGGMMILAFGLVLAGFAIAYATTKPYPEFRNEAAS
ncbi:hypothetical protein GCM10022281_10540 [Sphingomonas rosea]|uniref:DUF4190 domain-containing protein n=1 Tax=Sphingomonas rosea TaxID=335605 RepID=A0ABP7TXH5_9SPHN